MSIIASSVSALGAPDPRQIQVARPDIDPHALAGIKSTRYGYLVDRGDWGTLVSDYIIQDGNQEIRDDIPLVVEIVARTARWVHPETFRRLPVWCPWTARGRQLYD